MECRGISRPLNPSSPMVYCFGRKLTPVQSNSVATQHQSGAQVIHILEVSIMGSFTDMEHSSLQTRTAMKGSGRTASDMARENPS